MAAGKQPEWILVLSRFYLVIIRGRIVLCRPTCKPSTMAQSGRTSGKIGPFWVFLVSPFLPQAARMFGQSRTSSCLSKDRYAFHKPAGSAQLKEVRSKCPKPSFVLVVAIAAANGRVLEELLCIVPVAINSGDHLDQLRQLFVVGNEGHKRLVVSLLVSWRSLPLPRMVACTYTHHRLQGGNLGGQNFDTSIALFWTPHKRIKNQT